MLLDTETNKRSMTTTELEMKATELDIDTRYKNVFEIAREVKEVEMKREAHAFGVTTEGKDLVSLAEEISRLKGKLHS